MAEHDLGTRATISVEACLDDDEPLRGFSTSHHVQPTILHIRSGLQRLAGDNGVYREHGCLLKELTSDSTSRKVT